MLRDDGYSGFSVFGFGIETEIDVAQKDVRSRWRFIKVASSIGVQWKEKDGECCYVMFSGMTCPLTRDNRYDDAVGFADPTMKDSSTLR